MNIKMNIKKPSVKFKDVKVGEIFYFEKDNSVPYLKIKYYLTNGNSFIRSVNLLSGATTICDDNEYVRYYKESVLNIEV